MTGRSDSRRESVLVNQRILRIIRLLHEDTVADGDRRLPWRTTADRDAYALDLDGFTITVIYVYDTFSRETCRLEIACGGRIVESLSDLQLPRMVAGQLRSIFEHARQVVLGLGDEEDEDNAVFLELNEPE